MVGIEMGVVGPVSLSLLWGKMRHGPGGPAFIRALVAALVCAVTFAGLAGIVLIHAPTTRLDRRVQAFVVGHRTPWLNAVLEAWTWLGSSVVLIPVLLVVSGYLWWRRRDLSGALLPWVAFVGSVILYQTSKSVVGRGRPPTSEMLQHAGGYAFPSGHSAQAMVIWGLVAVLAVTGPRPPGRRVRVAVYGVVAVVILLVGVSRIYLGVHWTTDVAGGYALGGAWLALLLGVRFLR